MDQLVVSAEFSIRRSHDTESDRRWGRYLRGKLFGGFGSARLSKPIQEHQISDGYESK